MCHLVDNTRYWWERFHVPVCSDDSNAEGPSGVHQRSVLLVPSLGNNVRVEELRAAMADGLQQQLAVLNRSCEGPGS